MRSARPRMILLVEIGILAILPVSFGCAQSSVPTGARPTRPLVDCLQTCPEGYRCVNRGNRRSLHINGWCQLVEGRCNMASDCGRAEQCLRSSEKPGLCAPSGKLIP